MLHHAKCNAKSLSLSLTQARTHTSSVALFFPLGKCTLVLIVIDF